MNNPEEQEFTFNRVTATKEGRVTEQKTVLGKDLEDNEIALLAGKVIFDYGKMPEKVRRAIEKYFDERKRD